MLFGRRIDRRIAAYQRELIGIHYAEVENMYRQMRGWRHDYRSHIQAMKAHAAAGDWEAIKAYLDMLETDLTTVETVVKTGAPMADAILNSKISLARAKKIPVQADASIPVALKISELDLCVILGNLFDNAIEASLALPEEKRLIRVYIDMKGTQLYLSFTNFTAAKKTEKAGRHFPQHKGRWARLRACAHRRHCRAAGRLSQPQQRGRGVHHRDPFAAGGGVRDIQFSPQKQQFSPRPTQPGAFVIHCTARWGKR